LFFCQRFAAIDIADKKNQSSFPKLYFGRGSSIALTGKFAAVAAQKAGLFLIDIADVKKPRVAGFLTRRAKQRASP